MLEDFTKTNLEMVLRTETSYKPTTESSSLNLNNYGTNPSEDFARPPPPPVNSEEIETASAAASSVSGNIWVFLFTGIIIVSLVANAALSVAVLKDKRKHRIVYFLLLTLFAVNLWDYGVLFFGFSLGLDQQFPYSENACVAYQVAARSNPILQATIILVMLHFTANIYLINIEDEETSGQSQYISRGNSRRRAFGVLATILAGLAIALSAFSVPTAFFAKIVTVKAENGEESRFCEIDLSGLSSGRGHHDKAVSLYYLIYSALLSYWIPLAVSLPFLYRLVRSKNGEKYPEICIVLSTSTSFFVMYFLHGTAVLIRYSMDAAGYPVSPYQSWMLKILQSLFLLVAYFWHVARPALVILLDPDLKEALLWRCPAYSYYYEVAFADSPTPQLASQQPRGNHVAERKSEHVDKWAALAAKRHQESVLLYGCQNDRNSTTASSAEDVSSLLSEESV